MRKEKEQRGDETIKGDFPSSTNAPALYCVVAKPVGHCPEHPLATTILRREKN